MELTNYLRSFKLALLLFFLCNGFSIPPLLATSYPTLIACSTDAGTLEEPQLWLNGSETTLLFKPTNNRLPQQGTGLFGDALEMAGAKFTIEDYSCEATAGTLSPDSDDDDCLDGTAELEAEHEEEPNVPDDFQVLYVLTQGDGLVIQGVSDEPEFTVDVAGMYTIHTLVYDPQTLDLSIVEPGVTTGFDVNGLLIQGGGDICAALDVAGAKFTIEEDCPCQATAGTLSPDSDDDDCLDGTAELEAEHEEEPNVPDDFQVLYVLTQGDGLVIQAVSDEPEFTVDVAGMYTIHTLVYNPQTLDLSIVEPGVTTGFDVNGLLIQGGGDICAALDVAGAKFTIEEDCPCQATAGTLSPDSDDDDCLDGTAELEAEHEEEPNVPDDFQVLYVLTQGDGLVIQAVSDEPEFTVDAAGMYTIHTLVYNPQTLDLSIVEPGVTTGFDVNGLLIQGGGDICAALDVAGAKFTIEEDCPCQATAGTLSPDSDDDDCLDGTAELEAEQEEEPDVPDGFQVLYVLTQGDGLVIQGVSDEPEFTVDAAGMYTIHTLVYDPQTLDLSIVEPGVSTGFDVNGLLIQGGGDICAALDVAGAKFTIEEDCPCQATAGTLSPDSDDDDCLDGTAELEAEQEEEPDVPDGFQVLYVLTQGDGLVIQGVSDEPEFTVDAAGMYTIHTLVYDPQTLDLSIVVPGVTTGFDVNGLLIQGGGDICAALDVAGAKFTIEEDCPCQASAGTLSPDSDDDDCLDGTAELEAETEEEPNVPDDFEVLYVLTQGDGLVIQDVSDEPEFTVDAAGMYTIHTLVYNPQTLDLSIVVPGVTTGFDVNGLLIQGGGAICGALDVAGAKFTIEEDCPCQASAGTLSPDSDDDDCLDGTAELEAETEEEPNVPDDFEVLYVLTQGDGLVIQGVSDEPEFTVDAAGMYTIHTLVYNPQTLDLSIVVPGTTTGFDVNGLLIQGGGDICGALDVAGAKFTIEEDCPCQASAGTLSPDSDDDDCLDGTAELEAETKEEPNVPDDFEVLYVLTQGDGLVIQGVSDEPEFTVDAAGMYTIHTLVYNPQTLDLSIVVPGVTTGFDVNGLLIQGGGAICGALDVAGAKFTVEDCPSGLIYPNPVTVELRIPFPSMLQDHPVKIQLFDLNGRLVLEQALEVTNSQERIFVEDLPSGMYNIVIFGTGQVSWNKSQLIVKN